MRFEQAAMQVVADVEQAAGQRREAIMHMAVEVVAAFAAAVPFLDRVVEEHQRLAATVAYHLAVVFDGSEQRLAVGFRGVEEVVAVFGDDFVVVAEDEVVLAVELMQDAGDAGDVIGFPAKTLTEVGKVHALLARFIAGEINSEGRAITQVGGHTVEGEADVCRQTGFDPVGILQDDAVVIGKNGRVFTRFFAGRRVGTDGGDAFADVFCEQRFTA